jgi:hypothetical protein
MIPSGAVAELLENVMFPILSFPVGTYRRMNVRSPLTPTSASKTFPRVISLSSGLGFSGDKVFERK